VRQFNSGSDLLKAKFCYLCTNGCCRLLSALREMRYHCRNTLQYRCHFALDVRNASKSLSLQGIFFNYGKSKISQGAKSGELGGWFIIVMDFLARNSGILSASCTGVLSCWRIHLSGQSSGHFFRTESRNCLLLLVSQLILGLRAQRFVLCPHLHLSWAFLVVHFLGNFPHLLALPWTSYAVQRHSISS
jgi:hypothetical protein